MVKGVISMSVTYCLTSIDTQVYVVLLEMRKKKASVYIMYDCYYNTMLSPLTHQSKSYIYDYIYIYIYICVCMCVDKTRCHACLTTWKSVLHCLHPKILQHLNVGLSCSLSVNQIG